jgi:hypothetical protein
MATRAHLFLTLSCGGWGEATFGLSLAERLRQRNERVCFFTHASNASLFAGTTFEHHVVDDRIGSRLGPLLKAWANERDVASVVLCDSMTADALLLRYGMAETVVFELGGPVLGVDTWDYTARADAIDICFKRTVPREWIRDIPRLLPCPIIRPDERPGVCSFVSQPVLSTRSDRAEVRGTLGLRPDDAAVLFCTAAWQQQPAYGDADANRCVATFPILLAHYLSELGPDVHLIHVGPAPMASLRELGERYKWLPPQGGQFDRLLGAVDLLLSANVSATTMTRAILSRVPVLVLGNACRARHMDDAMAWLGDRATPLVTEWLHDALPLYPFSLWPLGFHDFISPLLQRNPYTDAIERVEWLDHRAVVERIQALLFSASARAALQQRQDHYRRCLGRLPTAADAFDVLCRSLPCSA